MSWKNTMISGLGVVAMLAAGCGPGEDYPIRTCEPEDGIVPICGFHDPEDLVSSPSGSRLIISQLGSRDGGPGSLVSLDPATGAIEPLVPSAAGADENWGESDCEPLDPSMLSPHGIDLEQRGDGRHELFVINHGGRESVELFEVQESGDGVSLASRGCVLAPPDGFLNDLVGLRSGGFWVSHMYPRDAIQTWAVLRMLLTSYSPGMAYEWTPEMHYRVIPDTAVALANGVEKSEDERFLFLNNYMGSEVVKIDVQAGHRVGSAEVDYPDNLSWSPQGDLLVASHRGSIFETQDCFAISEGSCPLAFAIVRVDPESMTARVALEHEGAPMGAVTVARPFGDDVYFGTFAGDRIARVGKDKLGAPVSQDASKN